MYAMHKSPHMHWTFRLYEGRHEGIQENPDKYKKAQQAAEHVLETRKMINDAFQLDWE